MARGVEEFLEERAQCSETTGYDAHAQLDGRPDADVCGVPEEVGGNGEAVDVLEADEGADGSEGAEGEDESADGLGAPVHLRVPEDCDGEDGVDPVCRCGHDALFICDAKNRAVGYALSLESIHKEVPRTAAHEGDEKDVEYVDEGVEAHDTVYEVLLPLFDADAQEEDAERELEEDGRHQVEGFVHNDPVYGRFHLVQVLRVRAAPIPDHNHETASDVDYKGELDSVKCESVIPAKGGVQERG